VTLNAILNCNTDPHYNCSCCICGRINAALVSIGDFFQKHEKILLTPTFEW